MYPSSALLLFTFQHTHTVRFADIFYVERLAVLTMTYMLQDSSDCLEYHYHVNDCEPRVETVALVLHHNISAIAYR